MALRAICAGGTSAGTTAQDEVFRARRAGRLPASGRGGRPVLFLAWCFMRAACWGDEFVQGELRALQCNEPHDMRVTVQGGQRAGIRLGETPQQHPLSLQDDAHRPIQLLPGRPAQAGLPATASPQLAPSPAFQANPWIPETA
jgi:hypothetical protein